MSNPVGWLQDQINFPIAVGCGLLALFFAALVFLPIEEVARGELLLLAALFGGMALVAIGIVMRVRSPRIKTGGDENEN